MSEERTSAKEKWNSELSERASRLTAKGAHHFIARLIAAGSDKPSVMAEFERVLHQLETAPHLRQCWKESDETGDGEKQGNGKAGDLAHAP